MLVEFSVENYKSFKERATLSMVAANITSEDPDLDKNAVVPISANLGLLRCAGVYGANASGKSNVVSAIASMRSFVLDSSSKMTAGDKIGVEPFRLSTETANAPSLFEVVFRLDGIQYRYGFEVTQEAVVSEWLFSVPKKAEKCLFRRTNQDIEVHKELRAEWHPLTEFTRPNALFLSVMAQFERKLPKELNGWFDRLETTVGLHDEYRNFTLMLVNSDSLKNNVISLIRSLDLGFEDIHLSEPDATLVSAYANLDGDLKDTLTTLSKRPLSSHIIYDNGGHPVGQAEFEIDKNESHGTRKLVALAGQLYSLLRRGGVFVVDELDARLHPLITRRIVEMFNSEITNPDGAQLIFVTHDTNLLDKSLLRRDQIWFAEKDRFASTHLVSLVEYKPRNDAALEKNYLQGRYGAIPFLGDLTRLPGASNEI
ncbi:MAG: AAA family ATPase [Capsulimonadaceae bacterium]|nr:AAA family ATPase [Capsulimonadaceae bacterium]